MNAAELLDTLKATPGQLSAWVKSGLPFTGRGKGRAFDLAAVAGWLASRLLESEKPTSSESTELATGITDLAAKIGVSRRTVGDWKTQWKTEGLPWADGPFPVIAVRAWLSGRDHAKGIESNAKLVDVRTEVAVWEFQLKKGRYVEVEIPAKVIGRVLVLVVQILNNVKDLVASRIPDQLTNPESWPQVRGLVIDTVGDEHENAIGQIQKGLREMESEIGGQKQ